jgi:hypothetical protein
MPTIHNLTARQFVGKRETVQLDVPTGVSVVALEYDGRGAIGNARQAPWGQRPRRVGQAPPVAAGQAKW